MPIKKGESAPRTKTFGLRQRAWWMICQYGSFVMPDILATIADGTESDARRNLGRYLHALVKAGIIKTEGRDPPGKARSNGYQRYQLVKDLGKKAPVFRASSREVFDPNSGRSYAID